MEEESIVNSSIEADFSMINLVIHNNDYDVAELLDFDMKRTNTAGETLLYMSSGSCSNQCKLTPTACRKSEMIKLCLRKGADIDAMNVHRMTPLLHAIHSGCLQVIKTLIEHAANLDLPHFSRNKPLHLACDKASRSMFGDHVEIVRLLVSHKADVNELNGEGNSPLHCAIMSNNFDVIDILLENNADVNLKNRDGETAFHKIAMTRSRKTIGIIKMLLRYNADMNAVDSHGRSPLHRACRVGHKKIIKFFLDNGVDINRRDGRGLTPIFYAHCLPIMQFLVENNADNSCITEEGKTLLHYVVRLYSLRKMKGFEFVINQNINARDNKGRTALHDAIDSQNRWAIEKLLNFAPDINVRDNDNHDAFYYLLQRLLDRKSKLVNRELLRSPDFIAHLYSNSLFFTQILFHNMIQYFIKLECIGIFIDNATYRLLITHMAENMTYPGHNYENRLQVADFRSKCNAEIQRLKNRIVGGANITFYNLLTKSVHSLSKRTDNEDVKKCLEAKDNFKNFPLYFAMIKIRFAESLQRRELMKTLPMNTLLDVFPSLPDEVIDVILSYLNHDDLKQFISVLQPCKLNQSCTEKKIYFEL